MSLSGIVRAPGSNGAGGDDSGAAARLEELFVAHAPAVFGFARRRASAVEADEVVSETFLVAWRRIDEVPAPALPWLLNVARKCMANRRRGEARQAALRLRIATVVDAPAAARPTIAPDDERGTHLPAPVQRALAALSPAEHDALTLLAWEGLTPAEAAVVLGCSRAAFYLRIHHARRRFARALADIDAAPERSNHED